MAPSSPSRSTRRWATGLLVCAASLAACGAGLVEVAEPELAATALATSAPEAVPPTPTPEQPPTESTPPPTSVVTVEPAAVLTPEPTQAEPVPTSQALPTSFPANHFEAPSIPVIPLDQGPEVPDWEPSLEQWETIIASMEAGVSDPDFDPKQDDVNDLLSLFSEAHTGIAVELPLGDSLGGVIGPGDILRLISRIITDGETEIVELDLPLISKDLGEADRSVVRLVFAVDPLERFVINEAKQSGDIIVARPGWPVEAESLVLLPVLVGPDTGIVAGDIVSISVPGFDQPIPARVVGHITPNMSADFSGRPVIEDPLLLVVTPDGWLPTLASAIMDDATFVVTVED